jgi:hypothetical protein
MSPRAARWIHRGCRWSLGAVFVLAAVGVPGTSLGGGKLRHPSSLAKSIRTYKMVPQAVVFPMAVYLPWLELTVGVALLAGLWRRESLALALGICGVFLIANVTALARGLEVDCGCFGSGYHGTAARETFIVCAMIFAGAVSMWTCAPPTPSRRPDEFSR